MHSISSKHSYVASAEIAKYDKLQKSYDNHTFEVVSSVFRALADKKIIGSGSFQKWVNDSFVLHKHF